MILDDGGDLTNLVHEKYPQYLKGKDRYIDSYGNTLLTVCTKISEVFLKRLLLVSTTCTRLSATGS